MFLFRTKPKITHIKIQKSVYEYNANKIIKTLEDVKRSKPDALAISLQMGTGSYIQTKIQVDAITTLSLQHTIPVYSFAEDYALGSGYAMLLASNHISVNPFTIIGCIGRSYKTLAITKLCNKLGLSYQSYSTDTKNENPYNTFRPSSPSDKTFIEQLIAKEKEDLVNLVKERRGMVFKRRGLTQKQLDDIFVNENFFQAEEAVNNGLADKVETFEEFQDKIFSDAKVNEIKIDAIDDVDLGALEFTTRRWSKIIRSLKVENPADLSGAESVELTIDRMIDFLTPEIEAIFTEWKTHEVQDFLETLSNEIVDEAFARLGREGTLFQENFDFKDFI